MQARTDGHIFVGMQQDVSPSKADGTYLCDAHNIRITAREGSTLLTLTNERGPAEYMTIPNGTYLGHCILNDYIVIFTIASDTNYIYRIDTRNDKCVLLYQGHLNFSLEHPIETLAAYENEHIQKVYWTDGYNQPRMINIVADTSSYCDTSFDFAQELQLNEKVKIKKMADSSGIFAPGALQYAITYRYKYGQETAIAYTTPIIYTSHKDRAGSPEESVANAFRITVDNVDSRFDYLRIYSILRTSKNATPICKRVADLEILASTSYVTEYSYGAINPVDVSKDVAQYFCRPEQGYAYKKIDAVRLYQSNEEVKFLDSLPQKKVVVNNSNRFVYYDIPSDVCGIGFSTGEYFAFPEEGELKLLQTTNNEDGFYAFSFSSDYQTCETIETTTVLKPTATPSTSISYIDTGTSGSSIDPSELLFLGGEEITAETMTQKDGTLFFGNIKIKRPQVPVEVLDVLREKLSSTLRCTTRKAKLKKVSADPYEYYTSLWATDEDGSTTNTAGFKRGEYYRLGVQLQYKNGKWGEPLWLKDMQQLSAPTFEAEGSEVIIPAFHGTLTDKTLLARLKDLGYRKARPLVVCPEAYERTVVCQGILNPTVYTERHRNEDLDLYAQASWICRPLVMHSASEETDTVVSPVYKDGLTLTYNTGKQFASLGLFPDAMPSRRAEIQGCYNRNNRFKIDWKTLTLNSPEFDMDDQTAMYDYTKIYIRGVGYVNIDHTLADIDIQTSTPTISDNSKGFDHRAFNSRGALGLSSGLFYEDYLVDDAKDGTWTDYTYQQSPIRYLIYMWNKEGSLNNDVTRPADKGSQSALLNKKCISHLRYADTYWTAIKDWQGYMDDTSTPEAFTSQQAQMLKLGNNGVYYGNIDSLLTPDYLYGTIFCFGATSSDATDIEGASKSTTTPFNSTAWYSFLHSPVADANESRGFYKWRNNKWGFISGKVGDKNGKLRATKLPVRMKYKSTPHLVVKMVNSIATMFGTENTHDYVLPIAEMYRKYNPATMFGGMGEDALKANLWLPCGPSVSLDSAETLDFIYGDTWYQRYDCLKTYPFTFEDKNQVVEIISFPVESHVNMDGRYDANRGQMKNFNMSPTNFNLINPVYSQVDNFFNYRRLDDDYYFLNEFPNQITWSKEKHAADDVDPWTQVTLASTYDLDGDKGVISKLINWNDNIYCFQDTAISTILFNSRVQVAASDGVPIEISNSYKVDGKRYVAHNTGCRNKYAICDTASGIYFMDTITKDLYHMGARGMENISQTKNMQLWSSALDNRTWAPLSYTTRLFFDNKDSDLYVTTNDECLTYSEQTASFVSFMSYEGVEAMFNVGSQYYCIKDRQVYRMFLGAPNKFFGKYAPYDLTFICNGNDSKTNLSVNDKIFTNLEFRADNWSNTIGKGLTLDTPFDYMRVWNEYQDTEDYPIVLSSHAETNLVRQYRIWRLQIPRDKTYQRDRIRNMWAKIKLGAKDRETLQKEELFNFHDIGVTFMV